MRHRYPPPAQPKPPAPADHGTAQPTTLRRLGLRTSVTCSPIPSTAVGSRDTIPLVATAGVPRVLQ